MDYRMHAMGALKSTNPAPQSDSNRHWADPTTQQLFTDTDLGRHMRYRPARLDHQAGSLLPELPGVPPTLARHTDNLPAGPAVPPVRYPP
jgi:hypothetical protein